MNLIELRAIASSLFEVAVAAADPRLSLRKALMESPLPADLDGQIILIAFGKASIALMEEALSHIPSKTPCHAIAVTNYENFQDLEGCDVRASGHPIPDQNGASAAISIIEMLKTAAEND